MANDTDDKPQISTEQRAQIILAAVGAAGSVGDDGAAWQENVTEMARTITAMLDRKSSVSAAVRSVSNSQPFTGVILGGKKEKSSKRWIVRLRTKPSDRHPDGIEEIRTERVEDGGLAMANKVRNLVGHKVVVWKEIQTYDNGNGKVRVMTHVQDLGEADDTEDDDA